MQSKGDLKLSIESLQKCGCSWACLAQPIKNITLYAEIFAIFANFQWIRKNYFANQENFFIHENNSFANFCPCNNLSE